ncbi:MAG: YjjG family noncanonical pyrimidine nucleotidase [Anaerotignum sp.]|nr:YjjG family noncanonical pyrimidine nucleotidase [Anaerotignum sp.]
MKKKFLLFDADRTLLDFSASEKSALAKTFAEYDLPFTPEVYQWHLVNNAKLWQDYEKGIIDRKTVLYTRFVRLFDHFGYEGDGAAFEDSYRHNLDNSCDLFPEAMEVVQALSKTHDLYIVTNGVASTQENRLRDSGLSPWFKDIFISEQVGSQKPQKEFFDHCFARIPGFDPAQALIIGDSLSSDIKGGNNAGIETCWFNPEGAENHSDAKVDVEIRNLKDLYTLLA